MTTTGWTVCTGVKSFGLVVSRLEDAWPFSICVSMDFINFIEPC